MKTFIGAFTFLIAFQAQAYSEILLKSMKCRGATVEMKLEVVQETYPGSMATVAWTVQDTETGKLSRFMGYLFTESALKEFRSTDLDSHVEVSGSVAVLRVSNKEETLFCK